MARLIGNHFWKPVGVYRIWVYGEHGGNYLREGERIFQGSASLCRAKAAILKINDYRVLPSHKWGKGHYRINA